MKNDIITIGVAPIRRGNSSPDFDPILAGKKKDEILGKIKTFLPGKIKIVDIDDIVDGGMLWSGKDLDAVAEKLTAAKIDGLFLLTATLVKRIWAED